MSLRNLHPNIKLRLIEIFIVETVGSMVIPFMAIYFASRIGAGLTGLLLAINVVIGVVAGIIGGYYSDKLGRKKIMSLTGFTRLFIMIVLAVAHCPAFENSSVTVWITVIAMAINSACWGLSSPAAQAMLIDVSTKESRKSIFAIIYWLKNSAFAIGGMVGAFLFKDYLFELFIGMAVAAAVATIIIVFFISETYHPAQTRSNEQAPPIWKSMFNNYRVVLKDKLFLWFMLGSMLIASVEFHLSNFVGIRLSAEFPTQTLFSFSGSSFTLDGIEMSGILRTANTFLVVVMAFVVHRAIQRYNDVYVYIAGVAVYTIGYAVLAYSNDVWILLLFITLATLGELMYVPLSQSYSSVIPPDHARSSYIAVMDMKYNFAMMIAAGSVSLAEVVSSAWMAILIGLSGFVGIGIMIAIIPSLERLKAGVSLREKLNEVKKTDTNAVDGYSATV